MNELYYIVDSSLMLFTRCTFVISRSETSQHSYEVIKASICLVLKTITHFEQQFEDKGAVRKKTLDDLDASLRRWLMNQKVIGGKMFGEDAEIGWTYRQCLKKGKQEKQVRFNGTVVPSH